MNDIDRLKAERDMERTTIIGKETMLTKKGIGKVQDRKIFSIFYDEILQIYIISHEDISKYNTRLEILSNGILATSLEEANKKVDMAENDICHVKKILKIKKNQFKCPYNHKSGNDHVECYTCNDKDYEKCEDNFYHSIKNNRFY